MINRNHSTPPVAFNATEKGQVVSIFVEESHPLLQLKRALPWDAIEEVMVKWWRAAGKNVDGGPGCPWDVSLYLPVVVLALVKKKLTYRDMEEYLNENVAARIFISRETDTSSFIRDHSNIARAITALGAEGIQEVNNLVVKEATRLGFVNPKILSADTTAQELPIGYPNEPGILKGVAQRCGRALGRLKAKGVEGLQSALDQARTVIKSAKEHHLFAKKPEEKQAILSRMIEETEELVGQTDKVTAAIQKHPDKVVQRAIKKLDLMKEIVCRLIPQIRYWMEKGTVAKGKILHPGIPQARSIVRNKTGKKVEFGLQYLISRIGGGYVMGELLLGPVNESEMPLASLAGYREIYGQASSPKLFVYDRGGNSAQTVKSLQDAGIPSIGIQPKGRSEWLVPEEARPEVMSQRGMTEGVIGTLKSSKYGFNRPLERNWETLQMAGLKSILSFNLNKLMRDLVKQENGAAA